MRRSIDLGSSNLSIWHVPKSASCSVRTVLAKPRTCAYLGSPASNIDQMGFPEYTRTSFLESEKEVLEGKEARFVHVVEVRLLDVQERKHVLSSWRSIN